MAYASVKKLVRPLGLYRPARWFNRHFLSRDELRQEKMDSTFYSAFLHPDDLVFDVGANYGDKSRVFLKLGCRVVAFEPQTDCLDELKARCGRTARLTTVQAAVSSTSGEGHFFVRPHRGLSGLVEDWEEEHDSEMTVRTVTLSQMFATFGVPRYVKIDVEGHELEVLKGLMQAVPLLSFEYHLRKADIDKVFRCVDYLSQFGELRLNITPAETLTFLSNEWLSREQFARAFPATVSGNHQFRYGDIFASLGLSTSELSDTVAAAGRHGEAVAVS